MLEWMDTATFRATVGTQVVELPIVALDDDLAIALLISVDLGVAFCATAADELVGLLEGLDIEVVVSVATMGIPVALEVTRRLGLDQYVILHKTPKIHLRDAIAAPVRSITTAVDQRLLLDRRRVPVVAGRRIALIDDVVSTGASAAAALRLLRGVGALPVAVGAIVTEGSMWIQTLGDDAALVHALGSIPLFHRLADGTFEPA
jgi:adenine/guanine phosphoribosyltransferase-like PRPP-binding protein